MKTLEAKPLTEKSVSIKKILVAVDLSDHSEKTAFYAAEIAKCFHASLTIAHVHEPVPLYDCASETTYTVLDDQRRGLEKGLHDLQQKVRRTGLMCETVYLVGEAAEQISTLAREMHADLIVAASHHPTFLSHLFNLQKAPKILHRAPCPVLIYQDNA